MRKKSLICKIKDVLPRGKGYSCLMVGQGDDLLREYQPVKRIQQGRSHDHCDKIDQIILGLALGVAQGELR